MPSQVAGGLMQSCLRTLLAVSVLATNFPQVFCCCGTGAAAARGSGAATACPRCCAKLGRTAPPNNSLPPPCCCQKCKAIQAAAARRGGCAPDARTDRRTRARVGRRCRRALGRSAIRLSVAGPPIRPVNRLAWTRAGDSLRPSADLIAIRFFRCRRFPYGDCPDFRLPRVAGPRNGTVPLPRRQGRTVPFSSDPASPGARNWTVPAGH